MRIISKHHLGSDQDPCVLELPKQAVVLHIGSRGLDLYLWEEHDTGEQETEKRFFQIVGTERHFDEVIQNPTRVLIHRGTVITDAGFTWHVYEHVAVLEASPSVLGGD